MEWREPEESDSIRILLADDHPVFVEGLISILRAAPDFEVVGIARTGREATRLAEQYQPDIVLMDVHMPELNGIDSTREIIRTSPHIGVLILSMLEDDYSIFSAMRAGARGYLLKGARSREIIRAVYAAADGESIFSAAIARRMMYYFNEHNHQSQADVFPQLTSREREVLSFIAKGHNNTDIGSLLGLRPKTVRNHVSNILNKLQVVDRSQAIIMARESGLGGKGSAVE
ncbi:response regulator transcription factor [Cohnella silvisoli]|uniref:Response regulator transcription factor n=1 Tax=Cohnella silvisoli TaxID=2873699 RepID=A0ABV1KMJ4_9BACL|nr:response regulator transcription factor [Cohnella silvisoli]MCD9020368.1 response regulator transcription factor [Cohnella silvisoli]